MYNAYYLADGGYEIHYVLVHLDTVICTEQRLFHFVKKYPFICIYGHRFLSDN